MSVFAILAYKSTHAIYHIQVKYISVLMVYCMMQWIKGLSLKILAISIFDLFFLNSDVYMIKTERYLDLYIANIF